MFGLKQVSTKDPPKKDDKPKKEKGSPVSKEKSGPAKKKVKVAKDPNALKKPLTGYFTYMQDTRASLKVGVNRRHFLCTALSG